MVTMLVGTSDPPAKTERGHRTQREKKETLSEKTQCCRGKSSVPACSIFGGASVAGSKN